jgi:hypothetical protein
MASPWMGRLMNRQNLQKLQKLHLEAAVKGINIKDELPQSGLGKDGLFIFLY